MNDEYKAVIMMNLRDFDAGRTARHGTYDLEGKLAELERVYAKAAEYEVKNKELLEELKYLKKVNHDLVWQRDTDEEHEAKAKAFDAIAINIKALRKHMLNSDNSVNAKRMETLNTLKHTEEIIKMVPCNDE